MLKAVRKCCLQAVLILLAYILHTTIFPKFTFNGISPNVLLLLTVFSSFQQGMNTGMVTGMICGLLCDIFYGSVLGVYGLFYLLIAFFAGSMARFFYKDEFIFPIVVVAVSDLMYNFVMYVTNFLLRGRFDFQSYFQSIILPELVYTLLLAVVCLPFITLIAQRLRRIDLKEKEKEETDVRNIQRLDQKDT
ncbi:MAG: rod shape-determining protein MreD [Lachnospiraceae bacterium]|nr:rod shape-determining protein MreD [Lachnospiraceae bacterium]